MVRSASKVVARLMAIAWVLCASSPVWADGKVVRESARRIPVAYKADVVVVGGGTQAVAAAVEAAGRGAKVFLAAPRPYLGEDICATLRLVSEGDTPGDPLARKLFPDGQPATPLHVKKTLDQALVDARVEFLFGCLATDVLRDKRGRVCGIVMANRAGRQAVVAKIIIDATDRAWVARLAGARGRPWDGGDVVFTRIVIAPANAGSHKTIEHELKLPMADLGFASLAAAEQTARDRTYVKGQLRAAERMSFVPPDPIVGRKTADQWRGGAAADVDHFRPAGVERVFVLSGCADVPRDDAAKMLRPAAMMPIGRLVGAAVADEAAALGEPRGAALPADKDVPMDKADVHEVLAGVRPAGSTEGEAASGPRGLPVLGRYDVVVIGGGTSGAAAAIGAARRGAGVLVVEYQEGLGGVGTLGMIGKPYHGRRVGFAAEVPFPGKKGGTIEDKMEWYRRQIRAVGGEIWLGAIGCGALVEAGRVRGAIVSTPAVRGAVLAKVVIDATGNADLARAAGAETMYGSVELGDIAMQGTGLPTRSLTSSYVNTDYLLVDESDMVDVHRALVGARQTMAGRAYDAGNFIQTRERRRVVGDHVMTYLDQIAGRTYGDSIVYSGSDYDSHCYPSDPYFALIPHDAKSLKANHPAPGGTCYTSYRCLLPKGLEGMLVAGLGISMRRDASAMVRMQLDIANQGYAAGVAAATAAKQGVGPRDIDVRSLQKHLVETGALPAEVLTHRDSFPLPGEQVRSAVAALAQTAPDRRQEVSRALAIVLSHPKQAMGMLREAWDAAAGPARLRYAKVLGVLGDKSVVDELTAALEAIGEWDAKILQGKMAEYAHLPTPTDAIVIALGYTRDRRAVGPILKKLQLLDDETPLSHHRSVAMALERIADPAAAGHLAHLLAKPRMRGHAMAKLEPLHDKSGPRRRLGPLREIVLARALVRCGDADGLGRKILQEYAADIRGLFARHARAVLAARPAGRPAPATGAKRWESHIRRFEDSDKADPPPAGAVLLLGSSSIRRWDDEKWFPKHATINRGFGGSQVSDSLAYAERILIPYRPRIVVFYAGDNDIAAGESPQTVLADYKALVEKVHAALPKTKFAFVAIKPSLKRWELWPTMKRANDTIEKFSRTDPRLLYVDVVSPMLAPDGRPRKELYAEDGLHLSEAGYKLWTSKVLQLLPLLGSDLD